MKKALFFICCFIFLGICSVFAQTQVAYTNQFFAAKIGAGQDKCFVFIYDDNFTLINFSGGKVDAVRIRYNMEGLEQVFIAGNRFFVGRRGSLFFYDLSRLTNPLNNGRHIDDDRNAFLGQIGNVSNISQNGDTVFITKSGDNKLYILSSDSSEERVISKIAISPGRFFNYVYNVPLSEMRQAEYKRERTAINPMITSISQIANNRTAIERIISGMAVNGRNRNAIYEALKPQFASVGRNVALDRINRFLELALITGELDNANSFISPAMIPAPRDILQDTIDSYYSSDMRIVNAENELKGRFGSNYPRRKSLVERLEAASKRQDYDWNGNHSDFNLLLKDASSAFINQDYNEYKDIQSLYNTAKRDFGGSPYATMREVISTLDNRGKKLQKDIILDFSTKYRELNQTIITTREQKITDYDAIIAWAVQKYIYEEISRKIVRSSVSNYNSDYIDYVIITDSERRINGFLDTEHGRMATDGFGSNVNDNNETPLFVRPSGYPIANITSNGIFILNSKNQVIAFDNSSQIITKNKIEPLTIDGGVFYMLTNENTQYIVSNNGNLYQLEIAGNRINARQQEGISISGTDTLLITPDGGFLIFANSGAVRGRSGTVNSFTLKACNADSTYSVSINNNGFIVR